jgi:hypothetical protein
MHQDEAIPKPNFHIITIPKEDARYLEEWMGARQNDSFAEPEPAVKPDAE